MKMVSSLLPAEEEAGEEVGEAEEEDEYEMVSRLYLQRKRLVRRLVSLRRRKEYYIGPLFTCRGRGW